MHIFSRRYMWKLVSSDSISFKIVTDTLQGFEEFEKAVLALEGLESFGYEYLHEYDCAQIGIFNSLFKKDV